MITNIIATIVVTIVTNTYQPTQYLDNSYGCLVYGCTQDHSQWLDAKPWNFDILQNLPGSRTRLNPDVRITEIREIKTLSFTHDGKEWSAEISNVVLSTEKKRRKVSEDWQVEP